MDTIEKKVHILVVDDDPTNRRLFGALLARAGYEPLYAKDGAEGREMTRRLQPDLVLLDLNMPVMDGWQTAERLKNEPHAGTAQIPVVFLTNEDLSQEAQKLVKEYGVVDYIQKGVSNEEFIARVKKVLEIVPKPETV
jgi:CheY-like chemotaxis protein